MKFPMRLASAVTLLVGACGAPSKAEIKTLSGLNEECEQKGFTGASVLARIASKSVFTLKYSTMVMPPAPTRTTVEVVYTGGAVRCESSYTIPNTTVTEPPFIRIDVTLSIATDDGAFLQTIGGTLSGTPDGVYILAKGPASENKGTYRPPAPFIHWKLDYGNGAITSAEVAGGGPTIPTLPRSLSFNRSYLRFDSGT